MQAADVAAQSGAAVVRRLLEQQQAWAASREVELADDEHVRAPEENLYPPSAGSRDAPAHDLARGTAAGKPDPARSLLSGRALAWNLLEPARAAFGISHLDWSPALAGTAGDRGAEAPALLEVADGRPVAALVRYREAYEEVDNGLAADELAAAWGSLAMCRVLAGDLHAQPRGYAHFPAALLVRVARELASRHGPRGYRVLYVWHEVDAPAARAHRREVDRFRMRVGGEVDFEARTLAETLRGLRGRPAADPGHLDWLEQRYLRT